MSAVGWSYVQGSTVHLTDGSTVATLRILPEPLSRKRPVDLVEELATLYAAGLTCDEIAGAVRVDGRRVHGVTINRWLFAAGVELRPAQRRPMRLGLAKQAWRRALKRARHTPSSSPRAAAGVLGKGSA